MNKNNIQIKQIKLSDFSEMFPLYEKCGYRIIDDALWLGKDIYERRDKN